MSNNLNVGGKEGKVSVATPRIVGRMMGSVAIAEMGTAGCGATVGEGTAEREFTARCVGLEMPMKRPVTSRGWIQHTPWS